jgi:hypothetical protein
VVRVEPKPVKLLSSSLKKSEDIPQKNEFFERLKEESSGFD